MVSFRSHLAGLTAGLILSSLTPLQSAEGAAVAALDNDLLDRWFAAQAELKTWSAELVQIRKLKALKRPLRTPGRVWFSAPGKFRWEIGDPAQTIAVRGPDALVVMYPRLKRAERYPLNGAVAGRWRDALTLLESGFPRSRTELEKSFKIVSMKRDGNYAEFTMVPKSAETRR